MMERVADSSTTPLGTEESVVVVAKIRRTTGELEAVACFQHSNMASLITIISE
jgi:hypothetical protein